MPSAEHAIGPMLELGAASCTQPCASVTSATAKAALRAVTVTKRRFIGTDSRRYAGQGHGRPYGGLKRKNRLLDREALIVMKLFVPSLETPLL